MEEQILKILKDIQPGFDFEEDVDFVENGYLDSFDVVTLVAELESTFSVVISALEIVPENFSSVKNISALVRRSPKSSKRAERE
ncbi:MULTISPECIES: acyl carrier protein [unclassified Desulfovibrio]|uniref:acyl carrier protein n=1 Tax=unclassified Desulfovibrio TaxID=2593640 RepID=UPI0013EC60EB|nr:MULTISPECIES: acyl carrier protein [unclassified Desulfovibrio]